ncbi:PAS domain S-box protein [Planctomycetota bacterium]
MDETRYKVLLLEDDSIDRKAFMRLIEKEQLPYDCTEAESLLEAHKLLKSEKYDIIIADYNLADGKADDILNTVTDIPIIIITGSGDEQTAVKAWRAGAYDYLTKDIEQNYLKTVPITIENAIQHERTIERLKLLSAAIRSTDDSVFITDMDNKIIFVNKAFCETYGYADQEIIGQNSDILSSTLQDSEAGSVFYHRKKDESEFPVSLSRSVIKDGKGNETAIVGVARDISERLYIEDRIRAINLQLRKGIRSSN